MLVQESSRSTLRRGQNLPRTVEGRDLTLFDFGPSSVSLIHVARNGEEPMSWYVPYTLGCRGVDFTGFNSTASFRQGNKILDIGGRAYVKLPASVAVCIGENSLLRQIDRLDRNEISGIIFVIPKNYTKQADICAYLQAQFDRCKARLGLTTRTDRLELEVRSLAFDEAPFRHVDANVTLRMVLSNQGTTIFGSMKAGDAAGFDWINEGHKRFPLGVPTPVGCALIFGSHLVHGGPSLASGAELWEGVPRESWRWTAGPKQ